MLITPERNRIEDRNLAVSARKEVIQPQVPLRLPCYDLVPVTGPAVAPFGAFQALPASMT